MLTSEEFNFIEHQFLLRKINLTEILKAGWVEDSETKLVTEYKKTWLGRLLLLPKKKDKIEIYKLRRYDVTLLLDGTYHCDFAVRERDFITVAGRNKWGFFYSKYIDEALKPSEKRLELEVWDYIMEEMVKIKPQLDEVKRTAMREIEQEMRK